MPDAAKLQEREGGCHLISVGSIGAGGPIRVKVHGSVLHAMLWVGLAPLWRLGAEEGSQAEFEATHAQNSFDRAFPQFAGQREDIRGDIP